MEKELKNDNSVDTDCYSVASMTGAWREANWRETTDSLEFYDSATQKRSSLRAGEFRVEGRETAWNFNGLQPDFRAPDLNWKNFSVAPDTKRIHKICSKNKRKFKAQQSLSKINGTITQKKVISTTFILVIEPK